MKQNLFNGIQKDGNLLGYVNHKNPIIFSDSFTEGIRSEWSKWVNKGKWSDYIMTENGKLKFSLSGSTTAACIYYHLPKGDWSIQVWCDKQTAANVESSLRNELFSASIESHKIINFVGSKVCYYNASNQVILTEDYTVGYYRIDKIGEYFYYYKSSDGLNWTFVTKTPANNGIGNITIYHVNSTGNPSTWYVDDFVLRRLGNPILRNMKCVHAYTRSEYSGKLLLGLLGQEPRFTYIGNAEGQITGTMPECSESYIMRYCTWTSKDGKPAMYFNGSNSVIEFPTRSIAVNMVSLLSPSLFILNSKFTVTAWAYIDSTTTSPSNVLVKSSSTSDSIDYGLQVDPAIKGVRGFVNQGERLSVPNSIRYNEWIHLALTFDSSLGSNNLKAYVNGSLVGQATYTTAVTTNWESIFVGSRNGVAGQFKGYLRNVRLYNTALSNEEIVDEMNRDYISPVEVYTVERSSITGSEEPPMQLAYY